jgi:peptide/nickel transport system permease protein
MSLPAPDISLSGSPPSAVSSPSGYVTNSRFRWRSFLQNLDLWLPLSFLVLLVLACFLWPEIHSIPNPIKGDLSTPNVPPLSPGHIFGTDELGNDVLSRILYGGRVSLEVGLGTTIIGTVIGGTLGAIAGLKGGITDILIMRTLEMFLAFPSLVLAIVVADLLGPSELHVIWAISFFSIPSHGRVARGNTIRVRESTFMVAAGLSGSKDWKILVRHVVPNIFPQMMTFGLLGVGVAIIVEAALSFLGLGVPPPGPSWGNMIAVGQQNLTTAPDLVIIPSAFLFATVLSLNLVGDSLRARWSVQ